MVVKVPQELKQKKNEDLTNLTDDIIYLTDFKSQITITNRHFVNTQLRPIQLSNLPKKHIENHENITYYAMRISYYIMCGNKFFV